MCLADLMELLVKDRVTVVECSLEDLQQDLEALEAHKVQRTFEVSCT